MSKIKQVRKQRGLRLLDLARKTGLSVTWLWHLENGGRASKEAKGKVARALRYSYKELFPDELADD